MLFSKLRLIVKVRLEQRDRADAVNDRVDAVNDRVDAVNRYIHFLVMPVNPSGVLHQASQDAFCQGFRAPMGYSQDESRPLRHRGKAVRTRCF